MGALIEAASSIRNSRYNSVVDIRVVMVPLFIFGELLVCALQEVPISPSQREFVILLMLICFFSVGVALNATKWTIDANGKNTLPCRDMDPMKGPASDGGCQSRRQRQNRSHLVRRSLRGNASQGHGVTAGTERPLENDEVPRTSPALNWLNQVDPDVSSGTKRPLENDEIPRTSPALDWLNQVDPDVSSGTKRPLEDDEVPRVSRAFNWLNQIDPDVKMLDDAQREGFIVDESNFATILAACVRQSHVGIAITLYKYMLEKRVAWDPKMVTTGMAGRFFRVVAESLDDEGMREFGVVFMESVLECGAILVHFVQNRVIRAWGSKPPKRILNFFMELRERGVSLSPTVYCCMMAAYEQTDPRLTLELYEEMVSRGIKVDRVAFNATLCACQHLGRTNQVMELLGSMPCHALEPNAKSYGTLVGALTAANKVTEALGVVESMRASSFEPNCFPYDYVIHCYVNSNRLGTAVSIYKDMLQANATPCELRTAVYLSRACHKQGWTKIAKQILHLQGSVSSLE